MKTIMRPRVHAAAGILAALYTSSIVVEIIGDESAIATTKTAILAILLLLVPSLAIAGATGRQLAGRRGGPIVRAKQRRMAAAGTIGVGVLIPCAITLQRLSAAAEYDTPFYLIQLVELVAGGMNLTLLTLNIRDGKRLAGKIRQLPTNKPEDRNIDATEPAGPSQ